ncbi:uncharacterized protein PGTG_00974 [Puccinia graminis f. sp. tritici CRL 75-36-700-3]|uniref:Uncharacterized protein n=1 Tax=Puccinia graminis f. sp. tritici (strain CRL 75-36-700-3 / race SCCL) TaxID=418459 RepID=E3JUB8_PUCGT|nr:uncharacterized protein PGTG_00974 [Puccinia graminis f. sp. tritici CRL 75-36-700-3]EFP75643.2 hypothetical protein PGTG_00974 [Puccinia graminis f. sp. tritici CRL 75-36-700-3]
MARLLTIPIRPYNYMSGAGGSMNATQVVETGTPAAIYLTADPQSLDRVSDQDLRLLGQQIAGYQLVPKTTSTTPSPPPPCDRSQGSLRPINLLQTGDVQTNDGPVAGGSSSSSSHSQPTCSRLTTGSSSSSSHSQPAQQRLHRPRPRPLNGRQVLRLLLRSSVPSLSPQNSALTDLVSSPHS